MDGCQVFAGEVVKASGPQPFKRLGAALLFPFFCWEYIYIYIYTYVYIYIYICRVYVYILVCMYVCMCVSLHILFGVACLIKGI